jgi:glyoxylase-like metal-dependent hydrolase (beta-lactamase superfamily II)
VRGRLYLKQYLSGRDFAVGHELAAQMANFAYVIGDRATRECVLVDPAYAVDELLDLTALDGMTVTGVLATHYHADHVGGDMMGHTLQGVAELLGMIGVKVHVNEAEAPWVLRTTGLSASDLAVHEAGDRVRVGGVEIELVHTPGHTPGSQCFLVEGCLVSGDTLFLDGCGRTDLPGSDAELMYESLGRLARLPDDTVVFPGHAYHPCSRGTMAALKEMNSVYKPTTREQWMTMFGH